jgi:hypothetical protein
VNCQIPVGELSFDFLGDLIFLALGMRLDPVRMGMGAIRIKLNDFSISKYIVLFLRNPGFLFIEAMCDIYDVGIKALLFHLESIAQQNYEEFFLSIEQQSNSLVGAKS